MTDETKNATATPDQPVDVAVAAAGDDLGVDAVAGIAVQGNQALIVAQFADMDSAKAAYEALIDAEVNRALDIDGVLVANADYQGKIHIQKMTDHKTRNGFLWGAVGGAVIGLIFPPTIIAGAVGVGIAGAAVGKAGNVLMKSDVADELAGVITPGTSGIVALVSSQRSTPSRRRSRTPRWSSPLRSATRTPLRSSRPPRPEATRRPADVAPGGEARPGQSERSRRPGIVSNDPGRLRP